MHRCLHRTLLGAALAATLGLAAPASQAALPFTYQGLLEQSGTPFNGNVNLEFRLYDAPSGGVQHGNTVSLNAWPVSDGLLNADLDFGNAVIPSAFSRWIEVRVNGNALVPRQAVMPAPLADSAQSLVGRGVANIAPASGQVLTWSGTSWMPQTPAAGSNYSAGAGLTLTGTTFSVNFGGSGLANTAARSDHHHAGAQWTSTAAEHTLILGNETTTGGRAALYASHTGTGAPTAFGVVGEATSSANAIGVVGRGALFGVDGNALGTSGIGVRGQGPIGGVLGTGTVYGVRGRLLPDNSSGVAVEAYADSPSGSTHAVYAQNVSSSGTAVAGRAAATTGSTLAGLFQVDSPNGVALRAVVNPSTAGTAVAVDAVTHHQGGAALRARVNHASSGGHAVDAATAGSGSAVRAESSATSGAVRSVLALTASPDGVGVHAENTATSGAARAGRFVANAPAATALEALAGGSGNAWGLYARSDGSNGAAVEAYATGSTGRGVRATAIGDNGVAIEGTANGVSARAGQFNGHVHVTGTLSKGGGSFKIDHPLDPENQYLYHSFVESPDMLNIYNGNITTDAKGRATVQLPDWFGALNRDFRYQLTVIGSFARAMVAEEVDGNRFTIRTDEPNTKVSWLVTGVRQDAWAQANRIPVEQAKPADEKGTLLHPEARGEPANKGLQARRAAAAKAPEWAP